MRENGRFGISPKEIRRTIVTAGAATILAAGAAASDSDVHPPLDPRILDTDKTTNVIDDPNFQGKSFEDFLIMFSESRTAEVELNQDLSNSLPLITRLVDMNRPSSGEEIQNLIAEYRLQIELSGGNSADYQPVILNRFQESTYIENGAEIQTNTWGIPVLLNRDGDLVHTVVDPSNQTVELVVFKKPQEGYGFNGLILQNIESGSPVAMLGVFKTQDGGIVPQGELPVALLTIDPETGGPSAIPVSEGSTTSNARLRTVTKPYGEITIIEGGQSIGIIGDNTEDIPGFDEPFRYAVDPETGAFGLVSSALIYVEEVWGDPWAELGVDSAEGAVSQGYSTIDSSEMLLGAFDRGFGLEDPRVSTRITNFPEVSRNTVRQMLESGFLKFDFEMDAFVTNDGRILRPDAIPSDGSGLVHGEYNSEDAIAAMTMEMGLILQLDIPGSEPLRIVVENPTLFGGALSINPDSYPAIAGFVRRNIEGFSRFSGGLIIISMLSDVNTLTMRNGNVAVSSDLGWGRHAGYSFSESGSNTNSGLIRINGWYSENGERGQFASTIVPNILVSMSSPRIILTTTSFGREKMSSVYAYQDLAQSVGSLSCEMFGLGSTEDCEGDNAWSLMQNSQSAFPTLVPSAGIN